MVDAAGTPTGEWVLKLPWTVPPLSMNDRGHWRTKNRIIAEVRHTSFMLAKHHKVPKQLGRISALLVYYPRDRRRRDPENYVATLKPLVDGLVDARIIPDDTPEFYLPVMPQIGEPVARGLVTLTIRLVKDGPTS